MVSSSFVFLIILTPNVFGEMNITEELRMDFFNIWKGLATLTKELTASEVTEDQITFHMFRNFIQPFDAIMTYQNWFLLENFPGKVIFITHGWTDSAQSKWISELTNAFLTRYPDSIVITIDWSEPAVQYYHVSALNVIEVGTIVGNTISFLVDYVGLNINQFLFVGHSLGGQLGGFVGKRLLQLGKFLPRIIALDPAGPLFESRPESHKLNKRDAKFVTVIHTDAYAFGYKDPFGHLDFYPNGGVFQPGCLRFSWFDFMSPIACDHQRAYKIFIEAVLHPNDFNAVNCPVWNLVQEVCHYNETVHLGDLDTYKMGTYYFKTNAEKPYSQELKPDGLGFVGQVRYIMSRLL